MNFFLLTKYLKYSLFSHHKRGFGIHSPFVFNLITKVFRNKTECSIVLKVESLRQELLADKRLIQVEDYGSGSRRMKNNLRKVSDIAQYSSVSSKYGSLLANISGDFGNGTVIELGTSLGISTMYMALANKNSTVYTIEGAPELSEIAATNFRKAGINNIISITGRFDDKLPELLYEIKEPGLVFIDGNHRKSPVLNYFNLIADYSVERTVVVLDDIYISAEMEEAWKLIKEHPGVTLSVDLLQMGIVFFRQGMTKEDYVIRY